MSYQKKSLILQEIEQAIRKKAQQKSRTKEQVGRLLQNSIQKKKNIVRTTNTKEQKVSSIQKNQNYEQSLKTTDKHVSLFNNEQLSTLEGDLKMKKYNNRRLDKLVSLIQYMVSSSEKVIKYISSTNFEAEFALKLYRSDKQNLLNQLKNLTVQDFIEPYRTNQKATVPKNDINYNLLLEENTKLKKDVMILQKQAERYMKGSFQQKQPVQLKIVQRQVMKLKETVRKLVPFQSFKKYMQVLQKQTKFESMQLKCQQNSKKVAELEIVIASLQNERNTIIQNINRARVDPKSQRSFRMNEIHGEKEQLQKEIGNLKSKISQMKQSSKLLEQYELLKKNSEHINQKLSSLAGELSDGNYNSNKRSSQVLIDFIKIKTKDYALFYRKQSGEVQSLAIERDQLQLLIKQKDEELNAFQKRMDNMHAEVQSLRENLQQIKRDKEELQEKRRVSQSLLQNKQKEIALLNQKLKSSENKEDSTNDIRFKNNQLRKELQNLSKRYEEKQKWLKDKIHTLETQKTQVQDKLMQLQEFLSHKNEQIEQLIKQKQSRQDSTQVIIQKIRIQSKKQIEELKEINQSIHHQLQNQAFKYQKLMQTYQESNQYYKVLTQSYNQKHQKLKQLEDQLEQHQKTIQQLQDLNTKLAKSTQHSSIVSERFKQLQLQKQNLENEKERVRKQNQVINQKLRVTQQQIIKNSYSLQQFGNTKAQNIRLNQAINSLRRQLQQKSEKYDQSTIHCNSLQEAIRKLSEQESKMKDQLHFHEENKKSLQNIIQQNSKQYYVQISSYSKKLHQVQLQIINLSKQKKQLHQSLLNQRDRSGNLSDKIRSLQRANEELRSEMRSLTILSNQIAAQKQNFMQTTTKLEEQLLQLKEQLDSTKQQIQDQSEINKSKTIQYAYLLRQILKGINLQTDYHHIESFEELLQFGSKQVVQMRKRLRQQESNRRRNNKKDQQYNFLEQSDSPRLQDLKTRLFQMGIQQVSKIQPANNQNQEENQNNADNEKLELNQFQDMVSQKANDSMISEDNRLSMEQFDDLKSQKLNQSMISNKELEEEVEKRSLLENNGKNDQQNNLIKINQSNQIQSNSQEDKRQEQKQQEHYYSHQNRVVFQMPYKPRIISEVVQINQIQSKLSSIPFYSNSNSQTSVKNQLQRQSSNVKKSAEVSKSSLKAGINLKIEQYQQVNSYEQSPKSQRKAVKTLSKEKSEAQQQISKSDSSEVVIYPLQKITEQFVIRRPNQDQNVFGADFDQFNEMPAGMNQSMISQKGQNLQSFVQVTNQNENNSFVSNKHSQGDLGMDEFGQIKNEPMNESMLSQKENDKQHGLSEFGNLKDEGGMNQSMLSEKEHGLSEFGDFKEQGMNQSMLSEKEHGLSQFGDLKEQEMSHSILSQKDKPSQHGLSDFAQFNQMNLANDSIISQQKGSISNANSEQNAANLDEFDQIKSDKMNDSILSEK